MATAASAPPTGRLQLALNVPDLAAAVNFYRSLFATEPLKVRPGYANFAIEEPPLKLVLFESDSGGTINHLGIEVASSEEVLRADSRLRSEELQTRAEHGMVCCYAKQEKVWLEAPDGLQWEVYSVLADIDTAGTRDECC